MNVLMIIIIIIVIIIIIISRLYVSALQAMNVIAGSDKDSPTVRRTEQNPFLQFFSCRSASTCIVVWWRSCDMTAYCQNR
jgi:hypothetical protein